ncbi:MAG TPA: 4Fe-4S dicluster domain-containing protein [Candidatus Marinimicrobia bacterium]|nr:4Fe-4S dicluster domain-containing protein [Candidatus Neomarinimicrobiota bacterium]
MYFIDQEKCTGCRLCIRSCLVGAISVENRKAEIDADKCTNCGACLNVCPFGAIYADLDSQPVSPESQGQGSPDSRFGFWQGHQRPFGFGMGRGLGRGMGRGFGRGHGKGGGGGGYR